LFDGLEEDNQSVSIDILSPKTSVKKLALKNIRMNSPSHRHSFTFSNSSNRLRSTLNSSLNESSGDVDSSRSQGAGAGANSGDSNATSNRKKSFEEAAPLSVTSPESSAYAAAPKPDMGGKGDAERRRGCGVSLTRGGYYIQPSIEELDKEVDDKGNCIVNNLVIGRQNHGETRFLQPVNVAGLDIDEIGM
jgi:nuclear pore complex protein Nup98-Nup96